MKTQLQTTILALAAVLAACGGSSSSDGGGTGGTGGSSAQLTRGAVTSKVAGAITVNGVVLSTATATVKVDDQPGVLDDVQPGDVVRVKGAFDDRTGTAVEIQVEHALEGQVEAKGVDFVVVGGTRIRVDDTTHFDDRHPAGIDSVFVGSVIRISGEPVAGVAGAVDDKGGLHASRLELSARSGGSPTDDAGLEVKGFVSARSATSFQLRATPDAASYYVVHYATAPAGLVDGALVEVVTTVAPVAGTAPVIATLTASAIHVEDRIAGAQVELEGYITTLSGTTFVVAGVTVDASAATYALGTSADLALGVEVEVEGSVDAGGVLHATKVTFEAGVRITAFVEFLSPTLPPTDMVLLGVPVQLPAWVKNDLSVTLANGVKVEVRGERNALGIGIVAQRLVDPTGNASRVFVRAPAESKSASSVVVMGYTVSLSSLSASSLKLADGSSAPSLAAFLAAVEPGHTVLKVRAATASDVNTGTHVWTADEVQIEGHD